MLLKFIYDDIGVCGFIKRNGNGYRLPVYIVFASCSPHRVMDKGKRLPDNDFEKKSFFRKYGPEVCTKIFCFAFAKGTLDLIHRMIVDNWNPAMCAPKYNGRFIFSCRCAADAAKSLLGLPITIITPH